MIYYDDNNNNHHDPDLILRQDNLARHKDQEMTCLALSQLVCVFKHLTSLLIEQHVLGVLKNEAANASAHKLSSAIIIHVASLQQPWIIPTCFPFLRESSRTQHHPRNAPRDQPLSCARHGPLGHCRRCASLHQLWVDAIDSGYTRWCASPCLEYEPQEVQFFSFVKKREVLLLKKFGD